MKTLLKFWVSSVLTLGLLSSCAVVSGGGGSGGSGGSGTGQNNGAGGSSSSTTIAGGDSSGFTFNSTDFFVDVNTPANTTMYLHLNGDWTQPCRAEASDPNQDLVCFLEIQEADLYNLGVTFAYNIPSAQCAYGVMSPYYYYQFQTGAPPTVVNETITIGATTTSSITSFTGGDTGATAYLNSANAVTCSFDHSQNGHEPPGPNCCEGTYILNLKTVDNTITPPSTTNSAQVETWPGLKSNCTNGPATVTQSKDPEGYPYYPMTFINGETLNSTYIVPAPITQTYRNSNVFASNYWAGPYAVSEANPIPASVPLAFWPGNPAQAGLATGAPPAQPWYEWDCLDEAGDYVNRIRVLVRSWSTHSQFALEGTPGYAGPQGVPFSDHDLLNWWTWLIIADPSLNGGTGGNAGFGNTYPDIYN